MYRVVFGGPRCSARLGPVAEVPIKNTPYRPVCRARYSRRPEGRRPVRDQANALTAGAAHNASAVTRQSTSCVTHITAQVQRPIITLVAREANAVGDRVTRGLPDGSTRTLRRICGA
jgi:hypothetical protein